eukprot:3835916-Pyramimonas_sp.AAC.1
MSPSKPPGFEPRCRGLGHERREAVGLRLDRRAAVGAVCRSPRRGIPLVQKLMSYYVAHALKETAQMRVRPGI